MMELLDQYQRLEIALKLGKGRRKKAQEGGYAGGRGAFGYMARKGQKELIVDPEEAGIIKRLFQLREDNPSWSLSILANQLNKEGYKTANNNAFTKVQVKRILDRKEFYQGNYQYGGIVSQGKHEAIL